MTNYTSLIKEVNIPELIKALRDCADTCNIIDECEFVCPYNNELPRCVDKMMHDAAAAIEALQAELEKKRTADCWGCKCEKVEPKRGEWVEDTTTYAGPGLSNYKCSRCGKICGTWRSGLKHDELPNWCGNCGAKMREVQE